MVYRLPSKARLTRFKQFISAFLDKIRGVCWGDKVCIIGEGRLPPSSPAAQLPAFSTTKSSEPPGDVIFGKLMPWLGEYLNGRAHLDQIAQVKIGGSLGNAGGLLHGVRHDDNGKLFS